MNNALASSKLNLLVVIIVASLMGCSSIAEKDANKDLFQQALVLQKVQGNARLSPRTEVNRIENSISSQLQWQFDATQIEPNITQRQELFLWFSQVEDYANTPILLQLGPDWISSYKRGNVIRKMIPRGIVIEQKYDPSLPKHKVQFSLTSGGQDEPSS